MLSPVPPPPYQTQVTPAPPYNATNFTSANSVELNTLKSYANNSPNYPWNTGSNAQQIYRSRQDISYFTAINQQTQTIKQKVNMNGGFQIQYPQFKTDRERMMYIQGRALTTARNQITGNNPSAPMGVPNSTIYQIINS